MRYLLPLALDPSESCLFAGTCQAFISGPAVSPQARLTVERRGLTRAGSAADPSLHLSARFLFHTPRSIFKSKRDRSPHYIRAGKH